MARPALLACTAVVGVACAAATSPPEAQGPPAPSRWRVEISGVAPLGPYLEATLENERFTRRFFFPPSSACAQVLEGGGEVQYRPIGPFGRLGNEAGARCEPVGVGSLREWRDALPRRRSRYLVPRDQAEFHAVHQGPDQLLFRGRFPLALEIRWPEPMDSVAVTPGGEACQTLLSVSTATMEFHAEGPEVFRLETASGSCPITGLVLPTVLE